MKSDTPDNIVYFKLQKMQIGFECLACYWGKNIKKEQAGGAGVYMLLLLVAFCLCCCYFSFFM